MGAWSDGAKSAGNRWRRTRAWIGRPVRKLEDEVHHLHELEQEGESGEAPFIAILGVFLFLVPIFLLMLGLALAAYYLAR